MIVYYYRFPSPYEVPNYKSIKLKNAKIESLEFPSPYEVPNYK